MAHWLACVLTGRHEYSMWCENGQMYLRCTNCGRRSRGWQVADEMTTGSRTRTRQAGRERAASPTVAHLSIVGGK